MLRSLFRVFTITDAANRPYLRRWYLLETRVLSIYLHRIMASDADRELHDHPRAFLSFLLWGCGYYEHEANRDRRFFPPFSWNHRPNPAAPHRLELPQDEEGNEQEQWTLVFLGPKVRDWGFHVPSQIVERLTTRVAMVSSRYVPGTVWVPHEIYLDMKFGEGGWLREPGYYEQPIVVTA